MKLIHVIVAYNSPNDINVLLEHIGYQNEQEHKVIIIDNSEESYRKKNSVIISDFDTKFNVKYYPMKNNIGSAKAFALGMQIAYQFDADWIWLHDQDGYPMRDCLKNIYKQFNSQQLIAPQVVNENNEYLKVFNGIYDKNDKIQFITLDEDINYTDVAATAGLMISRNLIDKIGVYDYKNYYVGMEDFDYCMRAKEIGIHTFVIRNAVYFHPDKWPGAKRDEKSNKLFFGFFGNKKVKGGGVYYRLLYCKNSFMLKYFYSVLRLLFMKLLLKKVFLRKTITIYIRALLNRNNRSKINLLDTVLMNSLISK